MIKRPKFPCFRQLFDVVGELEPHGPGSPNAAVGPTTVGLGSMLITTITRLAGERDLSDSFCTDLAIVLDFYA